MNIVYIHGATATHESFNYIREHLDSDGISINYDSKDGFRHNLELMKEELIATNKMFFVGHSLGGIYALHLADSMPNQVLGAVTLSTPYGGAEMADFAKFFLPYNRLLRDIGPTSWAMLVANQIKIQHPWTNVVTTKGNAQWLPQPNDGICTLSSQKYREGDMEIIEVPYNHYEVVLNDQVIKIIQERMKKIK